MSLHPRLKKMTITLLGHPMRAGKMTVIHTLGAVRFFLCIDSKDEGYRFAPVRAFRLRVE